MVKFIASGKYKLESVIASGSFGQVYQDLPFAIKEVRLPQVSRNIEGMKNIIFNEIKIMLQLDHPNLVKMFEVVEENNCIYIVMEMCDGDLRSKT